jgi:hypothetical protein
VSLGALALVGVVVWVVTSTLPGSGRQPSAAGDATQTMRVLPLQSLDGSPFAAASALAVNSPSTGATSVPSGAVRTSAAAAVPSRTATQSQQQASTKTSATAAPSTPLPPTVNVSIADASEGLLLDVENAQTAVGTLIGMWPDDNTAAQRWHLVLQPDGAYVVYTELMDLHEGLEINTDPNKYGGNTITTVQSDTGDPQMQWTLKYLGSNKYELVSRYDGKCLRAGAGQGIAAAATTCVTSDANQAWTIAQ